MLVDVLAETVPVVPLNVTMLSDALKFVPVIVTVVPGPPLVGLKLVIVGAGTVKFVADVAVCPATVTVIVPVVAASGTEVVMLVAVLAETTASAPLNFTMLLAGVVLKFVPVIVTEVPTTPLVGLKLVIVGAGAVLIVFRKIERTPETPTPTRSGLPSPSISPVSAARRFEPTANFAANETVEVVVVLIRTDIPPTSLATITSDLPSPLRSPSVRSSASPVVKLDAAANDDALITPEVVVFRNTDTEPAA